MPLPLQLHTLPEWFALYHFVYWDVPRTFLLYKDSDIYYFECDFDHTIDDYPDHFEVYQLNAPMPEDTKDLGERLKKISLRLPDIHIRQPRFSTVTDPRDPRRRLHIVHRDVFKLLIPS